MTIREAEELLDNATYADQGRSVFEKPHIETLEAIGIMNIHKVYYDGGWRTHPIIIDVLLKNPHGNLASVLRMVVDARVARREYKKQTLLSMYNLIE